MQWVKKFIFNLFYFFIFCSIKIFSNLFYFWLRKSFSQFIKIFFEIFYSCIIKILFTFFNDSDSLRELTNLSSEMLLQSLTPLVFAICFNSLMIVLAFLYYEQKNFLCICFLNDCLLLAINLFFLRYKIKWLLLVTFHLNESPFWWTFPFKWTFVNASQHVNRLQSAASKKNAFERYCLLVFLSMLLK